MLRSTLHRRAVFISTEPWVSVAKKPHLQATRKVGRRVIAMRPSDINHFFGEAFGEGGQLGENLDVNYADDDETEDDRGPEGGLPSVQDMGERIRQSFGEQDSGDGQTDDTNEGNETAIGVPIAGDVADRIRDAFDEHPKACVS